MDRLELASRSFVEVPPVLYTGAEAQKRLKDVLSIDLSNNDIEYLPEQQLALLVDAADGVSGATEHTPSDAVAHMEARNRFVRLIRLGKRSRGGDLMFHLASLQKLDLSHNKLTCLPVRAWMGHSLRL